MIIVVACSVLLPTLLQGQCISKQDYRTDKKAGIVVQQLILSGTRAFDSTQIAEVTANFVGSCFNGNAEEIGERIRDQFQKRGYLKAKVDNVTIKAIDPLAIPKPVTVEAEVLEGPLHSLSELHLVGNHIFTDEQLVARIPLKPGDPFNTERVRTGLNALLEVYGSRGHLDVLALPISRSHSESTVALTISVEEGKQYRMGKLQVTGPQEIADRLQTRWSLSQGVPFDATYLDKFIEENHTLLPEGFQQGESVQVVRNCREGTVAVFMFLGKGTIPSQPVHEIDCENSGKSSLKS
ncbi:MAG TPA: POTRA domain-containing protein [Clostridia bacterium]|nr:POTRA domain-containing protein [Clostridia bacterium]